ncbi:MAG TPA: DUF4010 domain-containing protein [Terriglobales bacterium]|jgi:uncharacterized membrane protein (DUF4010 family)
MLDVSSLAFRLMSALTIGLLIGAERERRKGEGPSRSAAGIRTFAIASLIGAVSVVIGSDWLLAVAVFAIAGLSTVAYLRSSQDDPGMTSEAALVLTVLLGGLAVHYPGFAAGVAVAVAVLLASREKIHGFVSRALSDEELNDALIFAAGIFVILPLVPDRYVGPFHAINPHTIWIIVILMMTISAAGYIAVRLMGPRFGLPLAGLASGFVSSAATISAMGAKAVQEPALSQAAVAGAVLSTVATIIELAIVLAATSRSTLAAMAIPLIASGTAAMIYGLMFTLRTIRPDVPLSTQRGRAFSLKTAVVFAVTIAAMLFISAALNAWFGGRGVLAAAAIAGFADTHSPSVSVASLVSAGTLSVNDALFPVLGALTTNTVTKIVLAITSGDRRFAAQVIPGLLLVIASAWAAALFIK